MRPRSVVSITAALLVLAFAATAAAAPPAGKKVSMCHRTQGQKGTHTVTIVVSVNAVPAHLRRGDAPGACGDQRGGSAAPRTKPAPNASGIEQHPAAAADDGATKTRPNPPGNGHNAPAAPANDEPPAAPAPPADPGTPSSDDHGNSGHTDNGRGNNGDPGNGGQNGNSKKP